MIVDCLWVSTTTRRVTGRSLFRGGSAVWSDGGRTECQQGPVIQDKKAGSRRINSSP